MQGEAHPVVVQPEIGERHVADDGVDAVLGQAGVAEVFDADVVAGVQHAGDPSGEAVELHADEAHACGGLGDEVADAAAGLQHGGIGGHAQVREGRVHRLDDHRRGVEGGEGGAPGAGVVLGRRGASWSCSPSVCQVGVFVVAGDRVRERSPGPPGRSRGSGRAPRAPRGWRAAGPARWPGACGSRPGWRGLWLCRRWRRGACGGTAVGTAPLEEGAWWRSTLLTSRRVWYG